MLKVVGASVNKTRIGTYILVGAGMLVIGAFFIAGMERPQYDGTYCAVANWTSKLGYSFSYLKQQTDLVNIPKGLARICYKDSIYENGWAQLELETQRNYPDHVQAYAAGFLEGAQTWFQINNQWKNTISSICEVSDEAGRFCDWLRETLRNNHERMQQHAKDNANRDPYWHQIFLYYEQLEGLKNGYEEAWTRAKPDIEVEEIPLEDLLILNSVSDIPDFKVYYDNFILDAESVPSDFELPGSTMFVKIFKSLESSGWITLFGHTSAGSYSSMLKIHKRYKLRYNFNRGASSPVHGVDISFTGYPGILASTDDFYIVKGKKIHALVSGVPIKNSNLTLWTTKREKIEEAVPLAARVMAANRLADHGFKWAKYMSRYQVTGSKQWTFIDLRKIDALPQTSEGVTIAGGDSSLREAVWISEQLPGYWHSEPVSEEILKNNFTWIGNGIPYFNKTRELSGISNYSNHLKLNNIPTVDENTLITLDSVDKFLRNISFRGDLLHGTDGQPIPYGNIDIKLFSRDSANEISDFYAFAGPVYIRHYEKPHNEFGYPVSDSLVVDKEDGAQFLRTTRHTPKPVAFKKVNTPFKWSSAIDEAVNQARHEGHPDEWNFGNMSPKWAWHD